MGTPLRGARNTGMSVMPKNRPWRRTIVAAVATGVHGDVASVVVRIHWGVIAFAVATRVLRDPAL